LDDSEDSDDEIIGNKRPKRQVSINASRKLQEKDDSSDGLFDSESDSEF
jgi:hypothetical protein